MIALVDTNVVLDVWLEREPFVWESARVLGGVERGEFKGLLCATTITTAYYIVRRQIGSKACLERIGELLSFFGVASVGRRVIESAAALGMADFEDAVLHQAAALAGAAAIVTRNIGDFKMASLPVYTPGQFLAELA